MVEGPGMAIQATILYVNKIIFQYTVKSLI